MLSRIMDGGNDLEANCAELMKLEDEADHISHDVMLAIRRSFITPFDRSDIKALISSMDDAIDQMNKTAKAVLLYEVTEFEPKMKEMAELTIQLADKTAAAVPLLRQINANSSQLHIMTAAMIRLKKTPTISTMQG